MNRIYRVGRAGAYRFAHAESKLSRLPPHITMPIPDPVAPIPHPDNTTTLPRGNSAQARIRLLIIKQLFYVIQSITTHMEQRS